MNKDSRAKELVGKIVMYYKGCLPQVKERGKSINLIATLGGRKYDVYELGIQGDFVFIMSKTEEGDILTILTPVEQVFFTVIISEKKSEEPPRQIGFNTDSTYPVSKS